MKDKTSLIAVAFILVLGFALASIIMAWPTQFLWNSCLVPAVTFAKSISFWQACGLNFLASILFKASVSSVKSKS